jgi:hypothetical protein
MLARNAQQRDCWCDLGLKRVKSFRRGRNVVSPDFLCKQGLGFCFATPHRRWRDDSPSSGAQTSLTLELDVGSMVQWNIDTPKVGTAS